MFAPAPPLPKSVEPRNSRAQEPGVNVARLLTGAWHENQVSSSEFQVSSSRNESQSPKTEDLNLSEPELNEITSLLCQLGAGALAWYKIRNTPLANTSAGEQLYEVYRRQRLSALLHERDLVDVLTLFRAEGIDAILVKGWAIARRYPDPALRSYGDLDLCVAPAQFAKAQAILKRIQTLAGPFVDLHSGFAKIGVGKQLDLSRLRKWLLGTRDNSLECGDLSPLSPHATRLDPGQSGDRSPHSKELDGNSWEELYARSQIVYLDISSAESKFQIPNSKFPIPKSKDQSPKAKDQSGFPVRILSDEDHLRILCLHLLRSGARRPAWLCDVALLVEEVSSFKFQVSSSARRRKPETLNLERETGFNWDVCLGGNPVHAEWVGVAIKLAHELLGADISHTPFARKAEDLPSWLAPAVLKQWGESSAVQSSKSRVQSLRALHARWDNPIRAVAAVGGQFDERSRLRYRLAELIARTPEVPDHLRRLMEGGRQ